MTKQKARSTDRIIDSMRGNVERLEVVNGLMHDHLKGNEGVVSPQAIELFSEQIRMVIFGLYDSLTDLPQAIDVETHQNS